jgi:hypothetical protein
MKNSKKAWIIAGGIIAGIAVVAAVVVVLVIFLKPNSALSATARMTVSHNLDSSLYEKIHRLKPVDNNGQIVPHRIESWPYTRDSVASSISSTLTPTDFQIKMVFVYLVGDVDQTTQNDIGPISLLYLNPECNGNAMEMQKIVTLIQQPVKVVHSPRFLIN